jgi:hypothetical protein
LTDIKRIFIIINSIVLITLDNILDFSLASIEIKEWLESVVFPICAHVVDVEDGLTTESHVFDDTVSNGSGSLSFTLDFVNDNFLYF